MEAKKYVLLKDVTDPFRTCKAGTESFSQPPFFCFPYEGKSKSDLDYCFMVSNPEEFPDWFAPVTPVSSSGEKIEVSNLMVINPMLGGSKWTCSFISSHPIPENKFDAVRKAIEFVLNPTPEASSSAKQDWEIVEYSKDGYKVNRVQATNPEFEKNFNNPEFWIGKHYHIHSVRRLSDGIVFTVFDEVLTNEGRGKHRINGFKVIDGRMCADMNTFLTKLEFIENIQHIGQPNQVEGKNWEIISIEEHGEIYNKDSAIFLAAFKTNLPIKINSVKRKSDGEIFILGQTVKVVDKDEPKDWWGQITEFWLTDGVPKMNIPRKMHIVYNGHHYDIKKFVKKTAADNAQPITKASTKEDKSVLFTVEEVKEVLLKDGYSQSVAETISNKLAKSKQQL